MYYEIPHLVIFLVLVSLLVLSFWIGSKIANRRLTNGERQEKSSFIIEGTLLSMLLGFTFGQAYSKFEKRKEIFINEVNCISTALMRVNLYPDSLAHPLKNKLDSYLSTRIVYYEKEYNRERNQAMLDSASRLSGQIENLLTINAKDPRNLVYTQLMVPAVNDMTDCITTMELSRKSLISIAVLRLLVVICIIVSFLYGYNQYDDKNAWFKNFGYAILIAMTFILILDLSDYRKGKIIPESEQKELIQLKQVYFNS